MKVTLGERIKSMGMFPDVSKLTDMFNQKFDALIAKLDEILAELRKQNGQVLIIVAIVVVLAVIGLLAVCTPGEDDHSLGRLQWASHEYRDCDPDWDDCGYDDGGNYGDGNYGQGRNSGGGGGNGNRGRRGDRQDSGRDSCHSFCGNTVVIPMPGETTTTTRGDQGE